MIVILKRDEPAILTLRLRVDVGAGEEPMRALCTLLTTSGQALVTGQTDDAGDCRLALPDGYRAGQYRLSVVTPSGTIVHDVTVREK